MPKKYLKEIIASVFIIGLATTFLWAFYSLGYLTIGNFIAIAVVVFIFWAIFTVILKVGAYQQKKRNSMRML